MKRAIVLSGGGSKGAYQIGAWKAIRKLKISYDIVTGTSVGALNAAVMTQNTFYKGLRLWYYLDSKMIFEQELDDYNTKEGKKEVIKMYAKEIINGGVDIKCLEKTVKKTINLKKFYDSKIDMGIVTFNVKKLKPLMLKKNKIKKEKLVDYLIASASCFPAFKMKDVDGELHVDGGIYDNLPINLAIDLGAQEVIAIDLDEIGIRQKIKNENIKVVTIKPKNNIGSFLVFEKNMARRAIKFGYNDTMKVMNVLDGDKFTFKHNELEKIYNKIKEKYIMNINKYIKFDNNDDLIDKILKIATFKRVANSNLETIKKDLFKNIEQLGLLFELDETKIYKMSKFNKLLKKRFKKIKNNDSIIELIKENKIKSLFSNKYTIKYIYDELEDIDEKKIYNLAILFPNEFLQAIYLKTIV